MAGDSKKQLPLRLSVKLYNELSAWAEDDFRSVNGQIEYLLTQCVLYRKKGKNTLSPSCGSSSDREETDNDQNSSQN